MKQFTIHNSQLTIKIVAFFFVLSIVHFQFSISAYAQEDAIGQAQIHPASPLYFLKAIKENLEMGFAATSNIKEIRHLEFATRRLREVKTLVSLNSDPTSREQDLIPPTLERYISHINSLTDKRQKTDDFAKVMQINLQIHLNTLRQVYNQTTSPRAKMFIRSAINRISQREDMPMQAKASICNFFAKEASSSALNETEKAVLSKRANKCRMLLQP